VKVTDYYYLVEEYERQYNVDCLSLEYVVAFNKLGEHPNPEAFLRLALRNSAINQCNKKKPINITDLRDRENIRRLSQAEDTTFDFYEVSECMSCFDQKVLHLRLAGFDYNEIAIELDTAFHNVNNALVRLRDRYRAIYEEDI